MRNEAIELTRSADVMRIPSGVPATLPKGARVRVMQALGDSYTLVTEDGGLVRLSGQDRDALGDEIQVPASPRAVEEGPFELSRAWDALRSLYDPEIPVNVVDLGLVYRCEAAPLPDGGHRVEVDLTMTAPGCGMGDVLREEARQKLLQLSGVTEAEVRIVLSPPWHQGLMSEAAMLQLGWI
jgi:probable FeS assembly SUF system protein SufT